MQRFQNDFSDLEILLVLLDAGLHLLLEVVHGVVENAEAAVEVELSASGEDGLVLGVGLQQAGAQVVLEREQVVVGERHGGNVNLKDFFYDFVD